MPESEAVQGKVSASATSRPESKSDSQGAPPAGLTLEEFSQRTRFFSPSRVSPSTLVELGAWLQSLSFAELERLLPQAEEQYRGEYCDSRGYFWRALAEKDARRAFDLVLQLPDSPFRKAGLEAAAQAVGGDDPEILIELAAKPENAKIADALRLAAVPSLMRSNPPMAFQVIQTFPPEHRRGYSEVLFSSWVNSDPAGAHAALQRIGDDHEKVRAREGIAKGMFERDPVGAWSWVMSFPSEKPIEKENLQRSLLQQWVRKDSPAAIGAAMAVQNPALRENLLTNILNSWVPANPTAALAWVEGLTDAELRTQMIGSLAFQSQLDERKLFKLMTEKLPGTTTNQQAYGRLAERWARKEPEAAAQAIASIPAGPSRDAWIDSVSREWSNVDRSANFQWLLQLPESEGRNRAAQRTLQYWAWHAPNEATQALAGVSGPMRPSLVKELSRSWASRDPMAVLQWAAALPDASERSMARAEAIDNYARHDATAAALVVSTLPMADRPASMERLMQAWGSSDPAAAATWLTRVPAESSRDPAAKALALTLVEVDPPTALKWAAAITDKAMAQKTEQEVIKRWTKSDPESAAKWKSSHP